MAKKAEPAATAPPAGAITTLSPLLAPPVTISSAAGVIAQLDQCLRAGFGRLSNEQAAALACPERPLIDIREAHERLQGSPTGAVAHRARRWLAAGHEGGPCEKKTCPCRTGRPVGTDRQRVCLAQSAAICSGPRWMPITLPWMSTSPKP